MERVSLFLYLITSINVLIITVLFLVAKNGAIRKAMIFFFVCLFWTFTSRWMTMDDLFKIDLIYIVLPLFVGSITLLVVLARDIANKIKEKEND